ncbi:FAD:protein FMN transferase [Frigoribacterium sp. 2-23]|uniref:FAD:protein FMN transferase n=1 Tax=Frigoribacterium sp. 2-23 TaxID=3415006 RepID=UPI003C6F5609
MIRTIETMGTVVSLHTVADVSDVVVASLAAAFDRYDAVFSLWRPDTELSRLRDGTLRLPDVSPFVLDVYERALEWRSATRGAFTPHRPDGVLDLSGIVKALAAAEAGDLLDEATDSWMLGAGGDVSCRGQREDGPWRCGIVDPEARDRIAGVVTLAGSRRALATSGVVERGDHVWRRETGADFVQVTVAAHDIVTADVLATAVLAGTRDDLDGITSAWDVDVLAVDAHGETVATPRAAQWCSA